MLQRINSVLRQNAPWSRTVGWWVVLLEGVITLAIGIYFLVQPQRSAGLVLLVLGGYLFISSILNIIAGLRGARHSIILIRAGIGLLAGLLVLVQPLLPSIDVNAARIILATGFLLSGLLGLYETISRSDGERFRWGALFSGLLHILLALLLFFVPSSGIPLLNWLGTLAIIIGLLLIIFAILMYREDRASNIPVKT